MFENVIYISFGVVLGAVLMGLWFWATDSGPEYGSGIDKVKSNEGESEPRIETRGRKKGTTPYKCRRCAGAEYVWVSKRRHCKPCWESSIEKRREYARKWYHANKKEKAGETE